MFKHRPSLRSLRPRSGYDVLAVIATVAALGTGGAYAASQITGANVVDDSLTGADVQESTLSGVKLSGVERVYKVSAKDSSYSKQVDVSCPPGKRLVSTGHVFDGPMGEIELTSALVSVDGKGASFFARESNFTDQSWWLAGQVLCANAE